MVDLYDIQNTKFSFEKEMKDEVILKFSNKQGGDYNVFAYHWRCFAWATIIGFLKDERLPLESKLADKTFSLNTMNNNDGEKVAHAIICMAIAKAGDFNILKKPSEFISLINEYADGGLHYIYKSLQANGGSLSNDVEFVKREIFSR